MNIKEMTAVMEKTAKEMCIDIRKGEYEVSGLFSLYTKGIDNAHLTELVGLLGAGVAAHINDQLKDEKLSNWLKANYEFMAISGEETKQGTDIHVGFIKRTDMGMIKKTAKDAKVPLSRGCSSCRKVSTDLLKCSGCKSVYYCCKEHQLEDWKKGHKHECKKLALAKN